MLFAILTKNTLFTSYSTFICSPPSSVYWQYNMHMYMTSAHETSVIIAVDKLMTTGMLINEQSMFQLCIL